MSITRKPRNLPSTDSATGAVMQSAGRYARDQVMLAYDMIGGIDAFAEWAQANKGDFYTKMFGKTIRTESEVTERRTIEDELKDLDSLIIDGEYEELDGSDSAD
jgi:hypothetical protein